MKTDAKQIIGTMRITRTYDVRVDPKTGQKSEVSPVQCMCCGRQIFKVSQLGNGDIVGSECEGILAYPVYRFGRTINSKQARYLKANGMLA